MWFINTTFVQYNWSTRLHKNKQIVTMDNISRFHCNASEEGAVDRKLLHMCEHMSKDAMNSDMWAFSPWLFSWLFNMDSIKGRVGTITFRTKHVSTVMEMNGRSFTMVQRRYSFMVDKIGRNVEHEQALIYSCWLRQVIHRILQVQGRIARKMCSTSNRSGSDTVEFGHSGNIGDIVDNSLLGHEYDHLLNTYSTHLYYSSSCHLL